MSILVCALVILLVESLIEFLRAIRFDFVPEIIDCLAQTIEDNQSSCAWVNVVEVILLFITTTIPSARVDSFSARIIVLSSADSVFAFVL